MAQGVQCHPSDIQNQEGRASIALVIHMELSGSRGMVYRPGGAGGLAMLHAHVTSLRARHFEMPAQWTVAHIVQVKPAWRDTLGGRLVAAKGGVSKTLGFHTTFSLFQPRSKGPKLLTVDNGRSLDRAE